ncbi:hypothetical protein [Pedobacter xixiisoli]|uniref:Sulfotransferase family protein n=1 Tax=Pedobacter xixiisoli TaxID=1476464 RepID=A0A286A630_9SPHI|nr:hypothetical protein [Pedobacter xixiisoli]SOD17373.1 hypothetical protein SAMN06297358_2514 [Pedobacter xixiisoli]
MEFLKHWLPYDLKFEDGAWKCLWIHAGEHHFNEPFFDDTLSLLRIKKGSNRYISCTNVSVLLDIPLPLKSVPVNAFIFHVSRCGSTLLSQALSVDEKHIVVPEAPIFDQVLRMQEFDEHISDEQIQELFKKVIAWYGQNRTTSYERYFIKLDSWHIHFYEQLRNWFPETPFYFLSREPEAIVTSHIKRRGIHAIPGYVNPSLLKINVTEKHYQDFNCYTELVIDNFYLKYIDVLQKKDLLNYFYDYSFGVKEMLFDFYEKVLKEASVAEPILSRLGTHSKDASVVFNGDEKIDYEIKHGEVIKHYHMLLKQITELS